MEFQENIVKFRKERGLSQEELAALCNVSRQAISKWENGQANPDLENLKQLSKCLQVSIDELLGNQNAQYNEKVVYVQTGFQKEYTSKRTFLHTPLVQVNIGRGRDTRGKRRVAKAWIAIGNTSIGLISIGFLSAGVISLGFLTFGICMAIGLLSLSLFAIGTLAIGLFAIGTLAIGVYTIGVLSIGFQVSLGVLAIGTNAIGVSAYGDHVLLLKNSNTCMLDPNAYAYMQTLLETKYIPFLMEVALKMIQLCA